MAMRLRLNGNVVDKDVKTLSDLITQLGLDSKPFAIEVNKKLVKKDRYVDLQLNEMDVVEIVTFVGGG